MTPQQDITIIGAGIVGVATALYLQREGHRVTLVERDRPGEATSFGNAGSLAPGSIIPLALPGTFRQVPNWILDPLGPLSLSWKAAPALVPWLLHFRRACNAEQVRRSAAAMRSLNRDSVDTYEELLATAGAPELVRRDGMLQVYRTEAGFAASEGSRRLRLENGARVEVITEADIRRLVPALSSDYRWGFSLPDGGNVRNPLRVTQVLGAHFQSNGGTIVEARVDDLEIAAGAVRALLTSAGRMPVDRVVLCAGVWSRTLAARIGVRVPVASERGYHIHVGTPGIALDRPVTDGERRFVATPMEGGLRFAGTSEFCRVGDAPNWSRADALASLAQSMLPGIDTGDFARWCGPRPSTPDGLPVIGPAPGHPNVLLAYGHGHWGLMAAPATGQVIADLVAGRPPRLDIAPFRPDRFD
jgi:D-amino-acid dehydrogenase